MPSVDRRAAEQGRADRDEHRRRRRSPPQRAIAAAFQMPSFYRCSCAGCRWRAAVGGQRPRPTPNPAPAALPGRQQNTGRERDRAKNILSSRTQVLAALGGSPRESLPPTRGLQPDKEAVFVLSLAPVRLVRPLRAPLHLQALFFGGVLCIAQQSPKGTAPAVSGRSNAQQRAPSCLCAAPHRLGEERPRRE